MEITTSKTHVIINCENSTSLDSLAIFSDQIVVAHFRSDPSVAYVYALPTAGALAKLVEMDSAGKFVASYVKPLSSLTHKVINGKPTLIS
jgi:hypothetical protein